MNSPWELIGSVIKYFRFSWEEVLWKVTYANLIMLLASIPEVEAPEKEKKEKITDVIEDLSKL